MSNVRGIPVDLWFRVRRALEELIPYYDFANKTFSLFQDWNVRSAGLLELQPYKGKVLDLGCGPGTLAPLLSKIFDHVVLLDASYLMLLNAKGRFKSLNVDLVQGVFEYLPFRRSSFNSAIASFSLRDSYNLKSSLLEACRVVREKLVIVDIGKPDSRIVDVVFSCYLRYVVPILTSLATRWVRGNPWRLIYETYKHLPRNSAYRALVSKIFGEAKLSELFLGAAIVLVGRKVKNHNPKRGSG